MDTTSPEDRPKSLEEVPLTEAERIVAEIPIQNPRQKRKGTGLRRRRPFRTYMKNHPVIKKEFAKNVLKAGGNKTRGYLATFPGAAVRTAMRNGPLMFKDPEVQQFFQEAGVDVPYLANKAKFLMDTGDEATQRDMVKHFTKPLLRGDNVNRVEKVSVSLFGELSDEHLQLIRRGNKLTLENGRTGQRPEEEGVVEGSTTSPEGTN